MRVYKKKPSFEPENVIRTDEEIDYKTICENIKNYLVFRISITVNLNDRLAYLDVLDYVERIQLKQKK